MDTLTIVAVISLTLTGCFLLLNVADTDLTGSKFHKHYRAVFRILAVLSITSTLLTGILGYQSYHQQHNHQITTR